MFILFILALSKEQLNQGAEQFYLWVPDIDELYLHSLLPLLFYTARARIKAAGYYFDQNVRESSIKRHLIMI